MNEAHLPALAGNPDAEIAALVDTDKPSREAAARRFRVANVDASHEALFASERPDGVIVATPHAFHFEQARDGDRGGRPPPRGEADSARATARTGTAAARSRARTRADRRLPVALQPPCDRAPRPRRRGELGTPEF